MEEIIRELVSIITDYGFKPDDVVINTIANIGNDKYLLEIKLRKYEEGYPTEGFVVEQIPVEIIEEVKKASSLGNVEIRQQHPVIDNDDLLRLVRKAGASAFVVDNKYEVVATDIKAALKRLAAFLDYPYTTSTGVTIFSADQFVSYFLRNRDRELRASKLVVEIPDFDIVKTAIQEDSYKEIDQAVQTVSETLITGSEEKELYEKVASVLESKEFEPLLKLAKLQNPDLFSEELHEATLLSDLNSKTASIINETFEKWGLNDVRVEVVLDKINTTKGIATGTISCYDHRGYMTVMATVKINPDTYVIEGIDSPLFDLIKSRYGVSTFRVGSFVGEATSPDTFLQALAELYPDNDELKTIMANKWKPVRVIDSSNPDSLVTYWEVYRDPVSNKLYLKKSEKQLKLE